MESSTLTTRQLVRAARPLVIGLGLAAYFVRSAGTGPTLHVVGAQLSWLPALLALQATIVVVDAFALRCIVGDVDRTSPWTWLRATAFANACAVFLPFGRTAGEAMRAAALAPTIGAPRAAGAAAHLLACSLFATSTASVVAALVTSSSWGASTLPRWLALNATICAALAGVMLTCLGNARLGPWLGGLLERLGATEASVETFPTTGLVSAYGLIVVGRLAQTAQYGIAVAAVVGRRDVVTAVTVQGAQLLGASIGDVLPGQLGAVEATSSAFADVLGVSDAVVRMMALAVLMRLTVSLAAIIGLVAAALVPRGRGKEECVFRTDLSVRNE